MKQQSEDGSAAPKLIELASGKGSVCVEAAGAEFTLQVQGSLASKVLAKLAVMDETLRVYLVLEQIRGSFDAGVLRLFLKLAAANDAEKELFLGSIGLYGLRHASLPKEEGGSDGMQSYLDITTQFAQLSNAALVPDALLHLSVRSHQSLPEGVTIVIERIRLYFESFEDPATTLKM